MLELVESKYRKIWFTSDTHYQHKNICKGVSNWDEGSYTRPFNSLEEMNETIVRNINNCVDKNDFLVHLGDWSFGGFEMVEEFRNQIECENIILILGNHDHHIERNHKGCQHHFQNVSHYQNLIVKRESDKMIAPTKHQFIISHYPIGSWQDISRGSIHLHGHIHFQPDKKMGPGRMMDAGMDGHEEFRPYSLDEILDLVSDREIRGIDLKAKW
jgi:calcineurin-like phosphoesterase family protein